MSYYWLNTGNSKRGFESVFMIQVRNLFTWPKTLLLIQIKKEFSRLPNSFTLGIPWPTNQHHRSLQITDYWFLITDLTLSFAMVTMPTLPLEMNCSHLAPKILGPIIPIAFRLPNSGAVVPTVIYDLQKRVSNKVIQQRAPFSKR